MTLEGGGDRQTPSKPIRNRRNAEKCAYNGVQGHPSDAWILDVILSAGGRFSEARSMELTESDVCLRKRRDLCRTPPVCETLSWGFKAHGQTERFPLPFAMKKLRLGES